MIGYENDRKGNGRETTRKYKILFWAEKIYGRLNYRLFQQHLSRHVAKASLLKRHAFE